MSVIGRKHHNILNADPRRHVADAMVETITLGNPYTAKKRMTAVLRVVPCVPPSDMIASAWLLSTRSPTIFLAPAVITGAASSRVGSFRSAESRVPPASATSSVKHPRPRPVAPLPRNRQQAQAQVLNAIAKKSGFLPLLWRPSLQAQ